MCFEFCGVKSSTQQRLLGDVATMAALRAHILAPLLMWSDTPSLRLASLQPYVNQLLFENRNAIHAHDHRQITTW